MARDLRQYARQTTFRLMAGGILLLFLVGDGLILHFYGKGAALGGLLCLAAGLLPLGLIWASLEIMGWIARRVNDDDGR